jgi:two-component system, cell cycle sensor histidine kinase and response regulator CckA
MSVLTVAQLAQELRTLLTLISSSSGAMRSRGAIDQQTEGDLAIIDRALAGAFHVSSRLLSLERPPGVVALDVSEAVLRARSLLARVLGTNIALVLELGTAATVMGDPVSFEWMMASLMANARDAMPAGGVVEVTTSVVTHRPRRASDAVREEDANGPDARYVRITVTDQGHGVAKSLQDQLFRPFFTTHLYATGLGLTSVALTAHDLGGWVDLESEPGVGTRVHLTLPLAERPVRLNPPQKA